MKSVIQKGKSQIARQKYFANKFHYCSFHLKGSLYRRKAELENGNLNSSNTRVEAMPKIVQRFN